MNESTAGLLIVFSQVGVVLLMLVIVFMLFMMKRSKRDKRVVKGFVETLKDGEAPRQKKLAEVLTKVHDMDEALSIKTAESMINCEKQIYNRVIKMYLGKDHETLPELRRDVENMASAYSKLIDNIPEAQPAERGENPKQMAQLKARLKQTETDRDKLQHDLEDAMNTMDGMMGEYASMYDGGSGKKEGVKHVENELSQLKQKISENLNKKDDEEGGDGGDDSDPDPLVKEKPVDPSNPFGA